LSVLTKQRSTRPCLDRYFQFGIENSRLIQREALSNMWVYKIVSNTLSLNSFYIHIPKINTILACQGILIDCIQTASVRRVLLPSCTESLPRDDSSPYWGTRQEQSAENKDTEQGVEAVSNANISYHRQASLAYRHTCIRNFCCCTSKSSSDPHQQATEREFSFSSYNNSCGFFWNRLSFGVLFSNLTIRKAPLNRSIHSTRSSSSDSVIVLPSILPGIRIPTKVASRFETVRANQTQNFCLVLINFSRPVPNDRQTEKNCTL
jgi:hypothetical protein